MAVIYLRHPIHGAKVATLDMEADFDERNGWERYTPGTPSEPAAEPMLLEAAPENQLARRGRPRKQTVEV